MRAPLASTLNRLVLTYGLGLLLAFAAVGAVSFFAFERLLSRDVQETVSAEHEGLMDVYRADGRAELRDTIKALVRSPSDREALYLLVERDGKVSAGHRDDLPASLPTHAGWLRFPWPGDPSLGSDDVLAFAQPLPDGGWLLTGHATGEQRRLRELVLPLGAAVLAALAALSGLLGWLLRRAVDRAPCANAQPHARSHPCPGRRHPEFHRCHRARLAHAADAAAHAPGAGAHGQPGRGHARGHRCRGRRGRAAARHLQQPAAAGADRKCPQRHHPGGPGGSARRCGGTVPG